MRGQGLRRGTSALAERLLKFRNFTEMRFNDQSPSNSALLRGNADDGHEPAMEARRPQSRYCRMPHSGKYLRMELQPQPCERCRIQGRPRAQGSDCTM